MAGILVRLVGLAFAFIQVSLLFRLMLPFVGSVPKALRPLVKPLIEFTDMLIAPFRSVSQPFDLAHLRELPAGVAAVLLPYVDRVDPTVIIAMIAWALIGGVVILSLRLVLRP